MKNGQSIVVLDGYTLNPGDLSWKPLEDIANCTIYDRTPAELIKERAADAEIVLTNKTVLSADIIKQLPKLKYIGVLATGYNVVDLDCAKSQGICVTNIPGYSGISVPQAVFALLLHLTNHVADYSLSVHAGDWSRAEDFCYYRAPIMELAGKTMGIVGYGFIGRQTADIARMFGMKVLVHTRTPAAVSSRETTCCSLEELLRQADVVSLHCPLTEQNYHLIDEKRLKLMKKSAILINTSRGPLIDEAALAKALAEDRIAAAALDVLESEPPTANNPLFGLKNCIITPHVAWATREARQRLLHIAADNIISYQKGSPVNVVS